MRRSGMLKTKASGLRLRGTSATYVRSPDSVQLSPSGDLDIRLKLAMDDWTPASQSWLVAKDDAGSERSFNLNLDTTGVLNFRWVEAGGSARQKTSSALGLTDGSTKWIRVVLDVDNGAAGYDVSFYTSDDGSSWSQVGATQTTAGSTSIKDTASVLAIGASSAGLAASAQTVYQAQILASGSLIASPNFAGLKQFTRTFLDAQGNPWSVLAAGAVI